MFRMLAATIPADPDYPARTRRLDLLTRVVDGRLYDGLRYAFGDEKSEAGNTFRSASGARRCAATWRGSWFRTRFRCCSAMGIFQQFSVSTDGPGRRSRRWSRTAD